MKLPGVIQLIILISFFGTSVSAFAQNVNDAYLNSEIKEHNIDKEEWKAIIEGLDYTEGKQEAEDEEDENINVSPSDNNGREYPTENNEPGAWSVFLKLLFITIIVIAVVALVMNLMGAGNFVSPKKRKRGITNDNTIDLENIEARIYESDLERYIREAVEQKNYTLAVRLYYLAIIKELSLNKVIRWKKDKTNKDYIREMRKTNSFQAFREATRVFERVWYGQGGLTEPDYQKIKPQFEALIKAAEAREIKVISG
jgi:hypothetical protein